MRIWPSRFCRRSRELLFVGLNIFLWIVLGLEFSRALYFVMAIVQLIEFCFVMILWASVLAFFPILVISSIHACSSAGLLGNDGMLGICVVCNVVMSGLLGKHV